MTLADLDRRCCHWPVGLAEGVEQLFCGAVVEPGVRYCAPHLARHPQARQPKLRGEKFVRANARVR